MFMVSITSMPPRERRHTEKIMMIQVHMINCTLFWCFSAGLLRIFIHPCICSGYVSVRNSIRFLCQIEKRSNRKPYYSTSHITQCTYCENSAASGESEGLTLRYFAFLLFDFFPTYRIARLDSLAPCTLSHPKNAHCRVLHSQILR